MPKHIHNPMWTQINKNTGKINENIKDIKLQDKLIDSLDEEIGENTSEIQKLNERVEALECYYKSGPLPDKIENVSDLSNYVIMKFGMIEFQKEQPTLEYFSAKVRDALALDYPQFERLNDQQVRHSFTRPDDQRTDVIVWIREPDQETIVDVVIDFCIGVDGLGTMRDKINFAWHEQPRPDGYGWWQNNPLEN
ncbi:MAG TPA: hypothetical protein ENH82_19120 [bacterium]|nr:hypothetical protein [bacterium]